MKRESPANLRKSLILVEVFKKQGIGFIPIPVLNEKHRVELVQLCDQNLVEISQVAALENKAPSARERRGDFMPIVNKADYTKDEVIGELAIALDLAKMEINHPNTSDIVTLMGIIMDALGMCEETE